MMHDLTISWSPYAPFLLELSQHQPPVGLVSQSLTHHRPVPLNFVARYSILAFLGKASLDSCRFCHDDLQSSHFSLSSFCNLFDTFTFFSSRVLHHHLVQSDSGKVCIPNPMCLQFPIFTALPKGIRLPSKLVKVPGRPMLLYHFG